MKLTKKHYYIITVVIVALLATGGIVALRLYNKVKSPFLHAQLNTTGNGPLFTAPTTHYLYIDADDNIDSVYAKLLPMATRRAADAFRLLAGHYDYAARVRTGRYAIEPGLSALSVFRRLQGGQQTPMMLTVPDVRTMQRLAARLGAQLMLDSATIAHALADNSFCREWGYDTATIACLFVPNTYEVYWDTSIDALMQRMKREHDAYWNDERRRKAAAQGLTPDEVVTLASIIDEETANNGEKPTIAGMYLNRLHRGMLLQADPTVKYAIGDFTLRRILNKHLEVESPYNTYKHAGLPPGPIRMPSLQAVEAVLNPQQSDYLYMCAKEDFSGTHNFARTLSEHNQNARRYQQALNKLGIR